ncbi:MAG TPA: protein kinase [Gemmataceae bacterium]|nr:protein kinase [Gemmataceae bacterium]
MISFRCGQCGKELKVKGELAGKKVKCPGCHKAVAVPQLAASPSPLAANVEPGPPKAAVGTEDPTVPPNDRNRIDNENLSDADAHTDCSGAWPPLARAAMPGNAPSLELVKFLKAAEKPDEIGRLGSYRVLQVLGAGGMGMVFKAEDTGLQRLVALKAMLPSMAGTPTAKERFFREARAVAALKHPHIVTIHQVGEEGGAPFLAMELLEGQTLEAVMHY